MSAAVSERSERERLVSLVEAYLVERRRRHELTSLTVRNQRCALLGFVRSVGNRPIGHLGRRDVERWLESLHGLAAATRRSRLSMVRAFCAWAVERRYLRRDPTAQVERVKVPRYMPRALSAEKVTRLLTACPDRRGELIVLLMTQEGLRCAEVAGLEFGDVDMQTRTIRVVGKGQHERLLPVSDETWYAIHRYLGEHPATLGPLIRSYRRAWAPLTPDTISKLVSEWMDDAGIKRRARDGVSAHALRHTAATDMLRAGAHLRDVQHALGHAHLVTTEVYLPLVVKDLRSAMGGRNYRGPAPSSADDD